MNDAEKWKIVEPLMKKLGPETVEDHGKILAELVKLADDLWPKPSTPIMLHEEEVKRRLPTLREMVKHHILHVEANGIAPKDGDHYIYECVLKVFYGDDIFEWYNKVVQ